MTYTPEFLPMTGSADPLARCALFVAFEGMGLLDLTGPMTVFWSASKFMEERGRHGYARHTVSLDGGPCADGTAHGLGLCGSLPAGRSRPPRRTSCRDPLGFVRRAASSLPKPD